MALCCIAPPEPIVEASGDGAGRGPEESGCFKHLFFWLLTNLMAPTAVFAMPFFNLYYAVGLFDTVWAVALAHCLFNIPLAVWISRGSSAAYRVRSTRRRRSTAILFRDFLLHSDVLLLIANGIGVTAFFCFMFSWVEQLLATTLTATNALPFAAVMTRSYSVSGTGTGRCQPPRAR